MYSFSLFNLVFFSPFLSDLIKAHFLLRVSPFSSSFFLPFSPPMILTLPSPIFVYMAFTVLLSAVAYPGFMVSENNPFFFFF